MTCNKKGPCKEEKAKNVEKMTDEQLDKVSGGKNIGCMPTTTPCEPHKHHHKHGPVGCGPTSTPKGKAGADFCGPFPSPQG